MDERAILAQAAHQARAGHHTAALGLLDRLATEGAAPSAAAFDLRARINAQLGFQLEAERCWVLASRADPTNPLYPLALERLRQAHRPGPDRRGAVLILAAMAVLALLAGQGLQQSADLREIDGQLVSDRALDQRHWDEASQRHEAVVMTTSRLDQTLPKLAHDASISARLETLEERQTDLKNELSAQIAGFAQTAQGGLDAERMAQQGLQEALDRIERRLDQLHEQTEVRFMTLTASVDSLRTAGGTDALPRASPLAAPADTSGQSSAAATE